MTTRRKFEIIKKSNLPELDFSNQIEKLKTLALIYGDYELAADIRKHQIKNNKKQ